MAATKKTLHRWDVGRITTLLTRPNWPRHADAPQVDLKPGESAIGRNGFVVLPGAVPAALCDRARADHAEYEKRMLGSGVEVRDDNGRNYRLTNFHLASRAALDITCNERVHTVLDEYFGRRSMVYTSLYFKHGSQQKIHIDTPFFVSAPVGFFAGVWVALEDVSPLAGPVEYIAGAHRLFDSGEKLRSLYRGCSDVEEFFARVRREAANVGAPEPALLRKGDVLIWHHGLPHGGQQAQQAGLTRHSMVIHMAAEGINVRYEGLFDEQPRQVPRYGLFRHEGRSVARVGLPEIMI